MRNESKNRKDGNWCVVGFCEDWNHGFGLQGCNYSTKDDAQILASDLDSSEEFSHIDKHEVMTNDDYRELCEDTDIEPPSRLN